MTEVLRKTDEEFYSDAAQYWSEIPATIDGMLGGFGYISQTDIRSSKMFLKQLFNCKKPPGRHYTVDCGAGIGRITKFLLTDLFEKVDLVEQNPVFLEQAKKYLGKKVEHKIGKFYPVGLQNFKPEENKYDIIWIQWVLGHLTDTDLVDFLKSCQKGLNKDGMIVIKENVTSSEEIDVDKQDSSVTRPMSHYRRIFDQADLEVYRQIKQTHFPKGLYTVYMFALKPKGIRNTKMETDEDVNGENSKTEEYLLKNDEKDDLHVESDTKSANCDILKDNLDNLT